MKKNGISSIGNGRIRIRLATPFKLTLKHLMEIGQYKISLLTSPDDEELLVGFEADAAVYRMFQVDQGVRPDVLADYDALVASFAD